MNLVPGEGRGGRGGNMFGDEVRSEISVVEEEEAEEQDEEGEEDGEKDPKEDEEEEDPDKAEAAAW